METDVVNEFCPSTTQELRRHGLGCLTTVWSSRHTLVSPPKRGTDTAPL